jgi:hypothetical protein
MESKANASIQDNLSLVLKEIKGLKDEVHNLRNNKLIADRIVGIKEVSSLTNIAVTTLRKKDRIGNPPLIKISGQLSILATELNKWMLSVGHQSHFAEDTIY